MHLPENRTPIRLDPATALTDCRVLGQRIIEAAERASRIHLELINDPQSTPCRHHRQPPQRRNA